VTPAGKTGGTGAPLLKEVQPRSVFSVQERAFGSLILNFEP